MPAPTTLQMEIIAPAGTPPREQEELIALAEAIAEALSGDLDEPTVVDEEAAAVREAAKRSSAVTCPMRPSEALHRLMRGLFRELMQAERSAAVHPAREARRLGDVPPARALAAVSAHARSTLPALERLGRAHELPVSRGAQALGEGLSQLRRAVVDRLVRSERSYRATLLGIQHGVDLVQLLMSAAQRAGEPILVDFCAGWLIERHRLLADCRVQAAWFAQQPQRATRRSGKR